MTKKLVSVVVLNWNGERYVHDCIKSILNQTYKPVELIIVDNASSDGSIEKIENLYSPFDFVTIIKNSTNTGFAKGMNIGIEACRGEFVALMNLDVFLDAQYIEKCVAQMLADKHIGFVGGCEYIWGKDGKLIPAHGPSSGALFIKRRLQLFAYKNKLDESGYCFGVTGSFPVVRKEMLDDIKSVSGCYFDEDFGTGWEDTDMRFRAFLRGWKTYYLSDAIGYHVGSSSAGGNIRLIDKSLDYQERIFRNRYYVIHKSIPCCIRKEIAPWLFVAEILLFPYYLIFSPKSLKALFRAKKTIRKEKQELIRKRNAIESNITIDKKELMSMFKRF